MCAEMFSLMVDGGPSFGSSMFRPESEDPHRHQWGRKIISKGDVPRILFFCELKPHAKFKNPTITPSERKVTRQKEERKTKLIVDT